MNKNRQIVLSFLLACAVQTAEAQSPAQVHEDFVARGTELSVFATSDRLQKLKVSEECLQALKFLYAYMPWPDVADYPLEYHVAQTECALRARREMPWGAKVPEREWMHFVLPVRINNENLDDFRTVCYEELRDRVKGMSMEQAVMEVNHWCHEHVTYKPSDSRTSSPLASMKTATGRCGEESTFTVAALRAVGIPARQVYTPRWAHTDDNHAWVEAWVDGKWYFLGACEPEPVLNLGWFNLPASRGMLMHTKVFGRYDGPEDVIDSNACYTEINITENYTKTARTMVQVLDAAGKPAPKARVDFKVYNYGELYSVQRTFADAQGKATILTGLGDMVVWASDGQRYGFAQFSAGKTPNVQARMDRKAGEAFEADLTLVPPVGADNIPEVTPEAAAENARRWAQEDSIRTAYVKTFADSVRTDSLCRALRLDYKRVRPLVVKSCGNWRNVFSLLGKYPEVATLDLLETLTDKDLRDFPLEVLDDHMQHVSKNGQDEALGKAGVVDGDGKVLASAPTVDGAAAGESDVLANLTEAQRRFIFKYVYGPRVANEMLSPWRSYFASRREDVTAAIKGDPSSFALWIEKNVADNAERNPLSYTLSPEQAFEARRADARNRGILFVAACRALGIPARIDEVTGKVQYIKLQAGEACPTEETALWHTVVFGKKSDAEAVNTNHSTTLALSYTPREHMENPVYYSHFTLSRLTNGAPVLQNYPEGDTWQNTFSKGTPVDAGDYLLTSGTRMADGTVLAHLNVFTINAGSKDTEKLVMREDDQGIQVIGGFNAENLYYDVKADAVKSVLSTTGRGYYVIGLIRANHEPTNHILHDIEKLRKELEAWGRPILLVFPTQGEYDRFQQNRAEFTNLPSTLSFGIDTEGAVQADLFGSGLTNSKELPLVVIADTFNRVVFSSQGYTIGLGESIKMTVGKLK